MLKRPEVLLQPVRILPLEGAFVTLDFGEWKSDFCKLWGPWGNDVLNFASLVSKWRLSGSATTGGSGFALSTNEVESKLCDDGTKEGSDLWKKCLFHNSSWLACVYFCAFKPLVFNWVVMSTNQGRLYPLVKAYLLTCCMGGFGHEPKL